MADFLLVERLRSGEPKGELSVSLANTISQSHPTMLSEEQVRHIAKLARIKLSDEEVKKFSTQLTNVLEYVDILSEVDTSKVAETSQVTGLTNMMEEDVLTPSQSSREELLNCSELAVDSNQLRVMRVVK